jgi:enoyl-CoA hydratase
MSYREIRLHLGGGDLAELILARPEARNAMTETMGAEVERAVAEINAAAGVRAVLVRGDGEAFSAGGDFAMLSARARSSEAENRAAMLRFYDAFLSIRRVRVPTIAVIAGPAVGAGLCFAVACDLRVAAAGTKLSASFVRLGLHPGMGASYLLPRLIGDAAAAELLLTGRSVLAEEALRLGLVNQVHPPAALETAARELAAAVAAAAPGAVAETKATLARAAEAGLADALRAEAAAQAADFGTPDFAEALRAAAERRPPRFTGGT